jgi:hypothetical protein
MLTRLTSLRVTLGETARENLSSLRLKRKNASKKGTCAASSQISNSISASPSPTACATYSGVNKSSDPANDRARYIDSPEAVREVGCHACGLGICYRPGVPIHCKGLQMLDLWTMAIEIHTGQNIAYKKIGMGRHIACFGQSERTINEIPYILLGMAPGANEYQSSNQQGLLRATLMAIAAPLDTPTQNAGPARRHLSSSCR